MSTLDLSLAAARTWSPELNRFVSTEHQRVAEVINDYDPSLRLMYFPDSESDEEFGIWDERNGGYVIRRCREDEVNTELVQWLFINDMTKHKGDDILARIDARQAAIQAMNLKRTMNEADEKKDFAVSMLKSKLNWYRHDGQVYRG